MERAEDLPMTLPATTDLGFVETLKKPVVIVDFWAPWCPPCKIMKPVIEKLSKDLKGKIEIVGANIDDTPQMAEFYKVHSIPTLIYLSNGLEVHRTSGAKTEVQILTDIKKYLA